MAEEKTTYVLELKGGAQQRVTVPSDWKVTFGPLAPGTRGATNGPEAMALRFYEGKEKQRACFMNVISFRDASIPIEQRVVKTKTQTVKAQTPEGMRDFVVEAKVHEWRNPDDTHPVEEAFTQLPEIEDFSFTNQD